MGDLGGPQKARNETNFAEVQSYPEVGMMNRSLSSEVAEPSVGAQLATRIYL
jgi:hypothetical protein